MASDKSNGGTFEDCTFTSNIAGNAAQGRGGAVYFHEDLPQGKRFQFKGTTEIIENTSGLDGGGIYVGGGHVSFTDEVTISSNTAKIGGGICQNGGNLEITTTNDTIKIESNEATATAGSALSDDAGGGGILAIGGTTTFIGTATNPIQIINNNYFIVFIFIIFL